MFTWMGILSRIFILLTGTVVGVIMYVLVGLNFEGAPGSMDHRNSTICLVGSILLLIGALVGVCVKRWVVLLPGTIVILIAWSSVVSVLWIFVVLTLLLLASCFIPIRKRQEDVDTNLTGDANSFYDVHENMEEMRSYKDEKDTFHTPVVANHVL